MKRVPMIELEDVRKSYGPAVALSGVNLAVQPEEILALVGDNGAGKSTIVKVLAGRTTPDHGVLRVAGEGVKFANPADARAAGVETVYQDLALVEDLPVWRNMFLGKEVLRGRGLLKRLDRRGMRESSMAQLEAIGITRNISPDSLVAELSGGQRQAVSIARAMLFKARVLVMDEPTAALGLHAANQVYDAMRRARQHGVTLIVVSHNIGEIYRIADRVTILQQGKVTATYECSKVTLEHLIAELVERRVGVVA